jgi:hypothetical protein
LLPGAGGDVEDVIAWTDARQLRDLPPELLQREDDGVVEGRQHPPHPGIERVVVLLFVGACAPGSNA